MRITKLILLFFFIAQGRDFAQTTTNSLQKLNKGSVQKPGIDSVRKIGLDSTSKLKDAFKTNSDSAIVRPRVKTYQSVLHELLLANEYMNVKQQPASLIIKKRQTSGKENLFYLLSCIILIFGLFKVFYAKYFHNIFRVFFNTSLRQNQLTDLLLQARLPSFIFNIFFSISAGAYFWLLLNYYYFINKDSSTKVLIFCIGSIAVIYAAKFCVLKFIGWLTGMSAILNTYIFVIFLINKIIGITLIPFIIFLAFAPDIFVKSSVIISSLVLGIFFLMRFFRSYSILQHQLTLSRIYFFLYIISLEILPLLIIYKLLLSIFLKL
ncbi:MAG: DUF4271 domain-containing protein [Ginsengibacter sp.]